MNRVRINFGKKGKAKFFLIDKKKVEEENITHLTVFNMILVGDKRRVLLFRISKECEFKNFWSFPAGHIESIREAENPVLAVIRETKEETGLKIKKEWLFVIEESGLKKARDYQISINSVIPEDKVSKEWGFIKGLPHMVIPFVSFVKDVYKIKLSNEFDRHEIVDLTKTKKYNLTPIIKVMIERFLKLHHSNRISE